MEDIVCAHAVDVCSTHISYSSWTLLYLALRHSVEGVKGGGAHSAHSAQAQRWLVFEWHRCKIESHHKIDQCHGANGAT